MGLFEPQQNYESRLQNLIDKAMHLELRLSDVENLFVLKKEAAEISREDFEIIHLVTELYHNAKIRPELASAIIRQAKELHGFLAGLQQGRPEMQNIKQVLFQLGAFLGEEQKYLANTPGAGRAQSLHIRLVQLVLERKMLVGKAELEIRGNKIIYDNKPINGVTLRGDVVEIVAEHYTLRAIARKLVRGGEINIGLRDPYVYVIEAGKLADF